VSPQLRMHRKEIAAKRRQQSTMVFILEQIFHPEFNPVPFQERHVFLLKGGGSMVFCLSANVFSDGFDP